MSNRKSAKWPITIGVVVLIMLSLGTIGYMYTQISAFNKVFADNVYIEDLAVGGLTKEEAKTKLQQDMSDEMSKRTIVFTNGKVSKEVPISNLGITYNIDEIIDKAFNVGHDEGFIEKYHIAKNGMTQKQVFSLEKTVDEEKIKSTLTSCADTFYVAPINATLKRVNRQFVTTKEVSGSALDIEATQSKLMDLLDDPNNQDLTEIQVDVVLKEVAAECTEESLEDAQTLVSGFSTSFNNASPNRNSNLAVACEKITTMILPDEVFKLSNQLEPFTEAAGYKNAGVIVNGKVEDGIGGGVCQVASTLYNAVLLTDLEIVMRQNHSLAVSYVPLGRDATYSTDAIDFQFKNNSGYPIFIEGYCENNKVIINIYGYKTLKPTNDIKFQSELIETIPAPATKYEDDPTLEEGKQETETTALDGKRVKLYKLYYDNGSLVNKVLVNTSYYKPRAAVVKRGTKKAQNVPAVNQNVTTENNHVSKPNTSKPTTSKPNASDQEQTTPPSTQEENDSSFAVVQE